MWDLIIFTFFCNSFLTGLVHEFVINNIPKLNVISQMSSIYLIIQGVYFSQLLPIPNFPTPCNYIPPSSFVTLQLFPQLWPGSVVCIGYSILWGRDIRVHRAQYRAYFCDLTCNVFKVCLKHLQEMWHLFQRDSIQQIRVIMDSWNFQNPKCPLL